MEEILRMQNISKSFPGVQALRGASFSLNAGEVHALIGENGAGKSTLMKILTGNYQADSGEIIYKGKRVQIPNPRVAQDMGINIVHQEVHMVPDISIAENIFIGTEIHRKALPFMFDFKEMNRRSLEVLEEVGLKGISPSVRAGTLSIAQQQMVSIARILVLNSKVVVFDEPTASLTSSETQTLFKLIRQLKAKGIGIIYISHRLEELDEIADRVSVFRDGMHAKTLEYAGVTRQELIALMVGRELKNQYPRHTAQLGKEILHVESLKAKNGLDIRDFKLSRGEVLGIYGLVGAGRSEFVRALFAADPSTEYRVKLFESYIHPRNTADAVNYGLGYLTENRKLDGLALELTVENNITMANLKGFSHNGVLNRKRIHENVEHQIANLGIKTPSPSQRVKNLSGGNQQKVIIGRWLSCNAKLLIFDEPTRGIDVGARREVYELINQLVENDVGVIVVSSDLPEVLGISDRIIVMHDMHITGTVSREEATQEVLLEMAVR